MPVLDGLVRVMRRIHAERNLELIVRPHNELPDFRGEEQDLQEMLGNLLDNACKSVSYTHLDVYKRQWVNCYNRHIECRRPFPVSAPCRLPRPSQGPISSCST